MGTLRLLRSDLFLRFPTRVSYGGGDFLRRSARSCMAAMSVLAARGTRKVSTPSGSLKAAVEFLSDCEIDWLDPWRRRSSFKGFDRAVVASSCKASTVVLGNRAGGLVAWLPESMKAWDRNRDPLVGFDSWKPTMVALWMVVSGLVSARSQTGAVAGAEVDGRRFGLGRRRLQLRFGRREVADPIPGPGIGWVWASQVWASRVWIGAQAFGPGPWFCAALVGLFDGSGCCYSPCKGIYV